MEGAEHSIKSSNQVSPSCPGLPELRQTLGEGRSALPLRNSKKGLKTIFFKVCHSLHYIKIIIFKVGPAKQKFLKKNSRIWETPNLSTDADIMTDKILKRLRDLSLQKKIKLK